MPNPATNRLNSLIAGLHPIAFNPSVQGYWQARDTVPKVGNTSVAGSIPDRSPKANAVIFPQTFENPLIIANGATYLYQLDFSYGVPGNSPWGQHSFTGQIMTVIMLAVMPATSASNQSILSAEITGDLNSPYYFKAPSSGGFATAEQYPASNGTGGVTLFSDVTATTGLQTIAWVCDPFNPSRFYRNDTQIASSAGASVLSYRVATTPYIARDWYGGTIYGTWTGQLISLAIFSQPLSDTAVKACMRQMRQDAV